jgi:hypothetical protein
MAEAIEKIEEGFDWFGEKTGQIGEGVIGLTEMVLTGEILAKLFGFTRKEQ